MLRVLHVIPSLAKTDGGPSAALFAMERALSAARGIEVTTITTDHAGPRAHQDVPLGQPIAVNGATRYYFRKQTEFYKTSWPLRAWLKENVSRFDIVHVHALFSFASVVACRAAREAGVPYIIRPLGVLNEYGMMRRRRLAKRASFRLVEKPLIDRSAAIHYTADAERRQAESLGIQTRAVVIPLGIDLAPFQSLPSSALFLEKFPEAKGRRIVLFLSRLDAKKGLDLLLPAFAEVRRQFPEVLLVIGGKGAPEFESQLKNQAASLSLSDHALFPGFLEGDLKLSAFAAATAFVLPSYSENFGIAALEALAAGVPSILSDQTAISEDVKTARAGIVVPCDASAIAQSLTRVLSESSLRADLSARSIDLARNRFSLNAMGHALKKLYLTVAAERAERA